MDTEDPTTAEAKATEATLTEYMDLLAQIAGCRPPRGLTSPGGRWMVRVAKQMTDTIDGIVEGNEVKVEAEFAFDLAPETDGRPKDAVMDVWVELGGYEQEFDITNLPLTELIAQDADFFEEVAYQGLSQIATTMLNGLYAAARLQQVADDKAE